jgi:hypothetical protein
MLFDTTQNVNAVNDERREGDLFDKFGFITIYIYIYSVVSSILVLFPFITIYIYIYIYISSCN